MQQKCRSLPDVIVNAAAVATHVAEVALAHVLAIVQADVQTPVKVVVRALVQHNVSNSAQELAMVVARPLVCIFAMALVMEVAKTIVTKEVY